MSGGGKLNRTETVTVRLDPKLNYLCDLAARAQRRTKSSFIEWAIAEALKSFDPEVEMGRLADDLRRAEFNIHAALGIRVLPSGMVDRIDAAKALGRTAKTLSEWKGQGIGPKSHSIGGREFYVWADVLAFMTPAPQ